MLGKISDFIQTISWSSAASILFGATISALVSYVLQRNSFAEARLQKQLDKTEERRALGLNVLSKMIRIASTIELLKQSLDSAFDRAKIQGVDALPWQIVVPIANFPGRVHFEPRELTEIMRLDFELFNDIGPFDDLHNGLIDLFELYRTERNALTDTLVADEMKGNLGQLSLTKDEVKRIAPKSASLNTLVAGMVERTEIDSAQAWVLLDRLQNALNKEFDLKLRLERKPIQAT